MVANAQFEKQSGKHEFADEKKRSTNQYIRDTYRKDEAASKQWQERLGNLVKTQCLTAWRQCESAFDEA